MQANSSTARRVDTKSLQFRAFSPTTRSAARRGRCVIPTADAAKPLHRNNVIGTDLRELSDEQLLALVKGEEEAAFEELIRRYQQRICGFAARLLRDPSAANDVAQETFLRCFSRRTPSSRDIRFGRGCSKSLTTSASTTFATRAPYHLRNSMSSMISHPKTASSVRWRARGCALRSKA